MPERVSDEAFARHLLQIGMARAEQVAQARELQAQSAQQGREIPIAEALARIGAITPTQREEVEKRLLTQQDAQQQLGQYKLLKKLGGGGMGTVYLAEDTVAQRKVALKVLQEKYASDPELLTRFRREARAAGKLIHANIVTAYNIGEEAGRQYYTMEYCEGETLGKVLEREKALSWDTALSVVIQVARGLAYAHKHGIIHRDIKPDNVFIADDPTGSIIRASGSKGVAKILDLGLSKNISDSAQSFYTQTGVAMGTPHYISPEQAKGEKSIDGRTDIYSLGATFYHLVTGQTPFSGTTAAIVMMKHLNEQLPNPQDIVPDLPDGVVQVIQRMMAKEPGERYADCAALLEDLELVREGKTPSSPAMDAARSTIAPRGGRSAGALHAPRQMGPTRQLVQRKGTRQHAAVGPERGATEETLVPSRPQRALKTQYLAYGAAGLGLFIFVVALVYSNKPDSGYKIQDTGSRQSGTAEPQAVAGSDPASRILHPASRAWPLHDGKEPIADYARRVALPAMETLDLGGGVKMEMVLVPAGEFMMGSNDGGPEEKPAHRVTLSQPYYLGQYHVTVAQFRAFAENAAYRTVAEKAGFAGTLKDGKWQGVPGANWRDPGFKQEDSYPAVAITWEDAQWFCNWASKVAGRTVRLPTEAEWEYAARGPKGSRYPWGDKCEGVLANVADASLRRTGFSMPYGETKEDDGYACASPVGAYKNASWCGAFDMAGNAWQWCQDYHNEIYYAASPLTDPPGPPVGSMRAARGGAWDAGLCRSAQRRGFKPNTVFAVAGFRVILSAPRLAAAQPETVNLKPETRPGDDARWGSWEDLFDGKSLAGWKVRDADLFARHGDVRVENGELVLRKGEQGTAAARAGEFPSVDYELTCELKMPSPMVSFPVGTSQWAFFMGKDFTGESGGGVGPVRVTRSSLSCTARRGFKVPFEEGKWYSIRLRVAAHKITAWIDGQERLDFDTTPHEEQGRGGDDTLKPLAVFTWQNEGAIRAIRLRRLKPGGAQPQTGNRKPETVPWPLHDGKEPIADYARRVGLPATETLDLGGGVKVELVLIPAGTFMMGSPEKEAGREADWGEGPQHEVTITKPFYMGKHEVTVAQFTRFVEATKYQTEAEKGGNKGFGWDNSWKALTNINWKKPKFPQEDNHPVCLISWNDAQAFCKWATDVAQLSKLRYTVRLPTEAEWEYACRAGTTTRFYTGNDDKDLDKAGWFDGNSGRTTHPVGQKAPNPWGLYDMHGNVLEWCEDKGDKTYYKESPRADPLGPTVGDYRLLRGGSWSDEPRNCRSAQRSWHNASLRLTAYGFRLLVVAGAER